jgi:hypothetical protein
LQDKDTESSNIIWKAVEKRGKSNILLGKVVVVMDQHMARKTEASKQGRKANPDLKAVFKPLINRHYIRQPGVIFQSRMFVGLQLHLVCLHETEISLLFLELAVAENGSGSTDLVNFLFWGAKHIADGKPFRWEDWRSQPYAGKRHGKQPQCITTLCSKVKARILKTVEGHPSIQSKYTREVIQVRLMNCNEYLHSLVSFPFSVQKKAVPKI